MYRNIWATAFLALAAMVSSDGMTVTRGTTLSITRHEVTWTFDAAYPFGQFANGDPWVVGPIAITQINPPSDSAGSRHMNGSMVNPPARVVQGYDANVPRLTYVPAMNVALDVSDGEPLVLKPGSSLVSTVSWASAPDGFDADYYLKTAAVLTVLDREPPPGSFRPPYCGTDKTVRFNRADLDYSKLQSLRRIPGTASVSDIVASVDRVWLDHPPGWQARGMHPTDNMPGYGRDLSAVMGDASLHLHLDYKQAEKEPLAIRLVQMGIDLYGIVEAGGTSNWTPNGGHASGRKWPILLAGIMLNDPGMRNIGSRTDVLFGEDAQTFFVQETSPDVYNNGHGNYGSENVGLAEWGNRHATDPKLDNSAWFGDPYRRCCTANAWVGFVLSARMMDAQALWNHDALFDYQDRYMGSATSRPDFEQSWSPWALAMWKAYRRKF